MEASKMTLVELKAAVYDLSKQAQEIQEKLMLLDQEIQKKKSEPKE